jgi:large subunit ribosomal protein L20|tara:strand:- start:69 stop:323 length:255 start_codon:yes stop_codon:yes gene_type:complete
MLHAQQYAFDHRRQKKGEMRRLWNIRINAAARANGISYSKLIHGLNLAGIEINRKMLSELAVADGQAFAEIVQHAQSALEQQAA